MNSSRHFRVIAVICCLALLPGCAVPPIKPNQTAEFYTPSTSKIYPLKPDQYEIPILVYPPARKYEVIGRFTLRLKFRMAEDASVFMNDAAEFNAHRVGADAILVVERWQDRSHHYYAFPNATDNNPGEPERETKAYFLLDAKMIVYK